MPTALPALGRYLRIGMSPFKTYTVELTGEEIDTVVRLLKLFLEQLGGDAGTHGGRKAALIKKLLDLQAPKGR